MSDQEDWDKASEEMTPEEREEVLSVVPHCRNTCSDENPINGYTTRGRGGCPRCDRCAVLVGAGRVKRFVSFQVYGLEEE